MTALNHPLEAGTVIASKYRVEKALSQNGSGLAFVYVAWHELLQQNVALKILSPELASDAEVTSRFLNEARAAVRLRNEHVAAVMDVGTADDGTPYIVLEHLDGENLETILEKRGPLPPKEVVDFVLQALEAVAHAHAQKIIHRDIKPSKLFVTKRHDGTWSVKVLDFGLAKITSGLQGAIATKTTAMLGSPAFMAPEQLRSAKSVDVRADVWSIGVVLFHLVTGKFPFEGESDGEIFASIIEKPAALLRTVKPDAPEELERVIAKCLSRKLEDRYANVGEVALALLPLASTQGAPSVERVCRTIGVAPPPPPAANPAPAPAPAAKAASPLIKFASKSGGAGELAATTVTDAPDHPLASTTPHQMEAPKLPPLKASPVKPEPMQIPKPPTSQALITTVGGAKKREMTGLIVVAGLAAVIGLGYYAWTSTRRDAPEPPKTEGAMTTTTSTVTAPAPPPPTASAAPSFAPIAIPSASAPRPPSAVVMPRPRSSKADDPTANPLLLQRN